MTHLKILKKGDIIDVVAPGFGISEKDLEQVRWMISHWGFVPRIPKDILAPHFLHSQSDEKRAEHLINAFKAKDSAVVWALRGGYGSNRLLPRLTPLNSKNIVPKVFIGISDVTSLHYLINQNWLWPSIHGSLLDRIAQNKLPKKNQDELLKFLIKRNTKIKHDKLTPLNKWAQQKKSILAKIIGGNLVTFTSLVGTQNHPSAKGKIVFFEEIGERGYKIDRLLFQLKEAGVFKGCRGIVFGQMTHGDEPDGSNKIEAVLNRFASEVNFPVLTGLEAGHGENQRLLLLGHEVELKLNSKSASLTFDNSFLK